jgi:hypothetical protein
MRIELLWFAGCPNHRTAEALLREVLAEEHLDAAIQRIEVPDEAAGIAVCFPGSPTIRVNGTDIEPGWEPCEDCTPRCRVYTTAAGLRGVPEREWMRSALRAAAEC